MDRKGIISVVLAVLVLLVWQVKFAPKFAPPPGSAADASPSPAPQKAAGTPGAPEPGAPAAAAPAPEENAPEHLQEVSGPAARYEFTNLGGGIARAALVNYPAESGSAVELNEFGTVPIGALSEQPGEGPRSRTR